MENVLGVRSTWMRHRIAYMAVVVLLLVSNTTTFMYATSVYNSFESVKCESTRRLQLGTFRSNSLSPQLSNVQPLRKMKQVSGAFHKEGIITSAPGDFGDDEQLSGGASQNSDGSVFDDRSVNVTDDCAPCECTQTIVTNIVYEDRNNPCKCSTQQETTNFSQLRNTTSHSEADSSTKTIFIITPTYHRTTQKIDLNSMCHTLSLIPKVVWIVIEDSPKPTNTVSRLIQRCSVEIVHLVAPTSKAYKAKEGSASKSKPRGVEQRNAGLNWLRKNYSPVNCNGVFYFGDDDNKYDLRLFEDIRKTQGASVWKVAWAGGLRWEGPTCNNGRAKSWHSWFGIKTRAFPLDMAGFAIHLCELFKHPKARVGVNVRGHSSKNGYLESDFLQHFASKSTVECRGSETETYVWHSHTSSPSLHFEKRSHSSKVIETQ